MAGTLISLAGGALAWTLSYLQNPLNTNPQSLFAKSLLPHLSPSAEICYSDSICFANATSRWSDWHSPRFEIVVRVSTTKDVEETIRAANQAGKSFLTISGAHGSTASLGKFKGVGIWMREMNYIEISEDGKSAKIGGGITSGELMHGLAEKGKESPTGACECTGAVAPMLGGGHGFLQGRYGLMADNLLSANLVLANGSSVTVSPTSHEELFWALRGAGHNFGIVTEFEYKIYDIMEEKKFWMYETMAFAIDDLEELFAVLNRLESEGNREMVYWGVIGTLPQIDPFNPIIMIYFLAPYATELPWTSLSNFSSLIPHEPLKTTLPEYASLTGLLGAASAFCTKGNGIAVQRMPVTLSSHPISALRDSVSLLSPFPGSFLAFESFSTPPSRVIHDTYLLLRRVLKSGDHGGPCGFSEAPDVA